MLGAGADAATTVRLCGPSDVELSGRETVLPGRQGRLAFAYLVVNRRRAVGRDELIELLWPERLPADPGEALSALLSRVRRAVGADVLTGRRELELVLPAGAWVDLEVAVAAAERADAALAAADLEGASTPPRRAGDHRPRLPGRRRSAVGDDRRRDVAELRLRALEASRPPAIGAGRQAARRRRARGARGDRGGAVSRERAPAAHGGAGRARQRGRGAASLREPTRAAARGAGHGARSRRAGAAPPPADRRRGRRGAGGPDSAVARGAQARDRAVRRAGPARRCARSRGARARRGRGRRSVRTVVEGFGATAHALGAGVLDGGVRRAGRARGRRRACGARRAADLRLAPGRPRRGRQRRGDRRARRPRRGPRDGRHDEQRAAALQRAAPAGAVAVDEATRAATDDALCFEPIAGPHGPGARPGGRRAAACDALRRARPRVGATARAARRDAVRRPPHLVAIVGEAGIGKSRLLDELSLARGGRDRRAVHRGRCLAYGEGVAYWALREILWDSAGVLLDDSGATAAGKLDRTRRASCSAARRGRGARRVGAGGQRGAHAARTAHCRTRRPSRSRRRSASRGRACSARSPPARRRSSRSRTCTGPSRRCSTWSRRSSRAPHGPLLVVATARPELTQARGELGPRAGTWQVALAARRPGRARARRGHAPGRADAPLAERVVEVAEGNPFYAEEIVRHLEHDGGAEPEIPATVRALLAARIDALPEAEQDVLQHAAVVGRKFWPSALEPTSRRAAGADPALAGAAGLHRGAGDVVAARRARAGLRARAHARGRLPLDPARCALPGPRRRRRLARGAGRRPPRRVRRRARPPLRGRGRRRCGAGVARGLGGARGCALRPSARWWRPAKPPAGACRSAQALRFADRALALADGAGRAPRRLRAARAQPPRRRARQPGARRLSRGDRARGHARRRARPRRACAATRRCCAAAIRGRSSAPSGRRTPTSSSTAAWPRPERTAWTSRPPPCSSAARGARGAGAIPIAEDLPRAKRDAERAAQIAEAIGSSLLVSIALEALTWIAFSQGDCEAMALGERHLQAAATLADRFEAHESLNMAVICFVRAGRFDRAGEIAAEAARQAPGMSAAPRAARRRPRRRSRGCPAGTSPSCSTPPATWRSSIAEERDHICATRWWRWRRAPSCCTRRGSGAAARAALELFDRVAPPDRPLVRWGPWIVEMQRAAAGLRGERRAARPTGGSATAPATRSTSCGPSSRCARCAASGTAPRSSRGQDARAGRLHVRAGARVRRRLGRRDAPGGRRAARAGARVGTAATARARRPRRGIRRGAADDRPARGLGDAAPRELVDADGGAPGRRWVRTPAPTPRASLAYARGAGA